jgi:hypothetical protein
MNERHPYPYQILLRGKLDLEQASWFPELSLTLDEDGDTQLSGDLPDQSALIGILFRAHNLNLQILSVTVKQIKTLSEEPNGNVQNT